MARSSPGVRRVVDVLNFFAEHPGQAFTLTDLLRSLKLSRATAHALLLGLVEAGYLYRTSDKSYVIGPALVAVGRAARENFSPIQVAQPEMRALADTFDATCAIAFREGEDVIIRDRAASISQLGFSTPIGARMRLRPPFSAIYYAWSPLIQAQEWLDQLTPPATAEQRVAMFNGMAFAQEHGFTFGVRTANAPKEKDTPEAAFRAGREQYGVTLEFAIKLDAKYDLSTVIAPVFDEQRQIAFVLTMIGFAAPRTGAEVLQIGRALRAACDRVGSFLSGKPAPVGRSA